MKRPTITQARHLADALGARQVIVIAFDTESFAASSYGQTRAECGDVGAVLDFIADGLRDRSIPAPGTIPPRRARA